MFGAIERGNGPESAFRAYLFTVVRRVAGLRREKNRRVQPTDDIAVLEAGTALAGTAEEPALAGFERGVVARAFHSLPERWQAVLWHTEVEGLTPAEIAPILGLTANGVAALAYRAREGLRQAYLQQHLQDPLDDGCRAVAGKLGAYVRGGLGTRETGAGRGAPRGLRRPVAASCSSWATSTTACAPSSRPSCSACSGWAHSASLCPWAAASRPALQRPGRRRAAGAARVPAVRGGGAVRRPAAGRQRVLRRRPGRSPRSAPAQRAVRQRPVVSRRSSPRSRSASPRWSSAAWRSRPSPRSPS